MREFICRLAGPRVRIDNKDVRPHDRRGQHGDNNGGQHPGLLLQRYLCENATGEDGNPEEKRAILHAAINASQDSEVQQLYCGAFERWSESLKSLPLVECVDLATEGRLIVGLGSENVLETGIRLHQTYGMPIIPGSALKGLAAHYCDQVWGLAQPRFKTTEGDYHRLLFGSTDDSGCIIFHDAWLTPGSPRPLRLDVMTPHHPKWLDGSVAPTDFDSPTPLPFLSVMGTFRIVVSWRGPEHPQAKTWTERAKELLCEALQEWGVGGKTSSGYGRLIQPRSAREPLLSAQPQLHQANPRPEKGPEKVTVKVLERRDIGGKVQYFVQEEGKPRGVLAYGTPPPLDELPQVGDEIAVYRNNQDARNPQYRWDKPITDQHKTKGGPGAKRPPRRR